MAIDEKTAAQLLWQIKVIATKEFESLPLSSKERLFEGDEHSLSSEDTEEEYQVSNRRWRAVSIESIDVAKVPVSSPVPSSKSVAIIDPSYADSPSSSTVEHHDWSKRKSSSLHSLAAPSLISTPPALITQKYGKRKRESFVGLTTQSGVVRGTLRKKFSWKQYPELEEYLIANQDEYFQFSSRNYTAEQRRYNNGLTKGLLDLAASEGYTFEQFTFAMVRDRIRCYYKSHSQSAKKKRRR